MRPTCLIVRAAGTNCDRELAYAFELAGAEPVSLHLNHLLAHPEELDRIDLIGLPGGFSYGDDIAAGRIFANRLRHGLMDALRAALKRGVPMIGICNGFQVLVKLGLLPDPDAGTQTATLADNTGGRFIDRWVRLRAVGASRCIWTRGLDATGDFELCIAHGEGRFVPRHDDDLRRWHSAGQVALRYAPADEPGGNPNGSVDDVAGVCDPSGLVLGLMPHPERCTHFSHHPAWSRRTAEELARTPVGLRFFLNAVEWVRAHRGAPAAAVG